MAPLRKSLRLSSNLEKRFRDPALSTIIEETKPSLSERKQSKVSSRRNHKGEQVTHIYVMRRRSDPETDFITTSGDKYQLSLHKMIHPQIA